MRLALYLLTAIAVLITGFAGATLADGTPNSAATAGVSDLSSGFYEPAAATVSPTPAVARISGTRGAPRPARL